MSPKKTAKVTFGQKFQAAFAKSAAKQFADLNTDGDTLGARDARTMASFFEKVSIVSATLADVYDKQAKRAAHTSTVLQIVADGMVATAKEVSLQATRIDDDSSQVVTDEGPDLGDDRKMPSNPFVPPANSDEGKYGLIGRDFYGTLVYYGPASKAFCTEVMNACGEDKTLDLVGPAAVKAADEEGRLFPMHQLPAITSGDLLKRAAQLDAVFYSDLDK